MLSPVIRINLNQKQLNTSCLYPVGTIKCPAKVPTTILTDSPTLLTSPTRSSVKTSIALGYLPKAYAEQGREPLLEYFDEPFPIRVEAVGCNGLYDPDNLLPRG